MEWRRDLHGCEFYLRCFFHVASRAQVRSLLDMPELSTLFAVGLAPFATIGARRASFDERRVNKRGSVRPYDYGSMCGIIYSSACTTYRDSRLWWMQVAANVNNVGEK